MFLNTPKIQSKPNLFVANLAYLLNKILGFDSDENPHILGLNGRIIQVVLKKVDLKFHCIVNNNRLVIRHGQFLDPDVTVIGSPSDFMDLFKSKLSGEALAVGAVQISGDLGVAKQFENLVQEIDFDTEKLLSIFFGDVPAHMAFFRFSRIKHNFIKTIRKSKVDLVDYMQHEKDLVPSPDKFTDFTARVALLSEQLELLETQAKILEKSIPRVI